MRRLLLAAVLWTAFSALASAQNALTVDQRVADLNQLASFYSKNYAPYEWKRDVFRFDLLNLFPWQFEAHKPRTDDLDFQELLINYVASLNDAHDYIAFPTTFSASLPLSVDIYDGKVLIDSINRTLLPVAQFPFGVGDELVSLDGQSAQNLIKAFRKYAIAANARSTDRTAASRIVSRSQQIMPHIHELGDTATVVIRLASTGAEDAYVIPWSKTGIPVTSQGPVPSPGLRRPNLFTDRFDGATPSSAAGASPSLFQIADAKPGTDHELPSYMKPILPLLNADVSTDYYSILGFGSKFPVWGPPPGFVIRKGALSTDFILSGTYVSNGVRIGFIRIPTMAPPNVTVALQQIDQEIAFFNTDTDGLIVDVMRNPGGSISFVESLAQRFMPAPFRTMGFEIRATGAWLFSFAAQLTSAELAGAPPQIVANLRDNYEEVLRAYNQFRGRSAPISLNSTGSLTLSPAPVTYSKPLMVLVDEFSASGADMFPAIIQDNHRGPIFGMRTMGAGGSVVGFNATAYTESFFRVTVSLMNRGAQIQVPNFPSTPYIENIGVRPDKVEDYMTRENLVGLGAPFVQAFTAALEKLVQTGSVN
jgi:Peptidase family S41/PDZ domain